MAPVKYNFDTSFGDSRADAVQEELDALRRQIGEAREEGRREGMAAGRTQALGELEAGSRKLLTAFWRLVPKWPSKPARLNNRWKRRQPNWPTPLP
ncbi:hypothetical protein JCM17843_21080 [Kordiimonadales bacterium JCM 17843]|nr:hypothetical protein JCM17843_21080 [Kordiimonadales bacterium JCM 17843]